MATFFRTQSNHFNFQMPVIEPLLSNFLAPDEIRQLLFVCFLFLIVYCGLLIYSIPKALDVGSHTFIVSIIHRWSGIITLLLPIMLMAYEAIYLMHPDLYLYLCTVIGISFNCIFGALMIPKRIPKWDIPTIRIFIVAVSGGLSFVCLSLNFKFGHIPSFEAFGKLLAVLSVISMVYAVSDLIHHLHQFAVNINAGTAMDFGFNIPSQKKDASAIGLNNEAPSLWYCFVGAFLEPHHLTDFVNAEMMTPVHSNISVLFLETMNLIFALTGLLQFHYLFWGYEGMIYLQNAFPKLTRMAVYGFLGAALANNFGTFAGTLVLKRKMNVFNAAVLNVIAALVPLLEVGVFVVRYNREERLDDFLWAAVTGQIQGNEE